MKKLGIILALLILLSACGTNTASSQKDIPQLTEEEFKASCEQIAYKDLMRTPDEYAQKNVVLVVQIKQILDGNYRCYSDNSGHGWYFDDEYYITDGRKGEKTKLLEDDIIIVYGTFSGLKKVTRAIGWTTDELPKIKMCYVTLVDNDADTSSVVVGDSTLGQQNATKQAKSYLDFSAFSYEGLIQQLEFEKFSHEDAVYGADHCDADWNEQAAKKAKSYLEIMNYSKEMLINQLEYEGFTHDQAVYGAEANGY